MLTATTRPFDTLPSGVKRCARCGVEREARKNAILCRDCVEVLTAPEKRLWAA